MMQTEEVKSFLQQELDQDGLCGLNMGCYASDELKFYSLVTSPDDSSMASLGTYFQINLKSDFSMLPNLDDDTQIVFTMENIYQNVEGVEGISGTEIEDVLRWWGESEDMDNVSSDYSIGDEGVCVSPFINSTDTSIVLPQEDMDIEGQTSLCHLLKAYGESMEMGQRELVNVIVGCIKEKASPLGGTMERVAFTLFDSGNQVDYIKQESVKNFKEAFKAFYEIFPYGRFSHFTANSAILEAIMSDSGKVHIIDFDIGEGVQWSVMLEAIGKLGKEMKLTSIRTNEPICSFEMTKGHLIDYANASGLKLEVQEITIGDLVREIEGSEEHEFLAFNCMVGLPHMGRTRNRNEVMEFLMIAKRLLFSKKGIITFGDGEDLERMKHCSGYGSFFDECLTHYQALCESMEGNFPDHLTEARLAMESIFVSPYVSSLSWHQKWQYVKEDSKFNETLGLVGWRLSNESILEAIEMIKGRRSSYKIKVVGHTGNEMVLEWRGTPLVRVSAWK